MNKTKIEYVDYTVNPITGTCLYGCFYCYANRMRHRFNWATEIKLDLDSYYRGVDIRKLKNPSRIFVGSMHDIFGEWVKDKWINDIIVYCSRFPQHTFLFLTKNPKRYLEFQFPDNCWLGVTVTGRDKDGYEDTVIDFLENNFIHNLKFISYEPLLHWQVVYNTQIFERTNWLIIGALTGGKDYGINNAHNPLIENAIKDLITLTKLHNIPIFLKDNLKWNEEIKEFPEAICITTG